MPHDRAEIHCSYLGLSNQIFGPKLLFFTAMVPSLNSLSELVDDHAMPTISPTVNVEPQACKGFLRLPHYYTEPQLRSWPFLDGIVNRHKPHSEIHTTLATPGVEHSRSTMFSWIRDHTRFQPLLSPNALTHPEQFSKAL
jgi:hypothetical protein